MTEKKSYYLRKLHHQYGAPQYINLENIGIIHPSLKKSFDRAVFYSYWVDFGREIIHTNNRIKLYPQKQNWKYYIFDDDGLNRSWTQRLSGSLTTEEILNKDD